MGRCVSNLVAVLILVGITISVGIVVARILVGGYIASYDKPAHLQVVSKHVRMVSPRVFRIEVVFSNPTGYPFCVRCTFVEIYTSSRSPSETLTPSDATNAVVSPGTSSKYELTIYTARSYTSGVIVPYFSFYLCQDSKNCTCAGYPAYLDAVVTKIES